MILKTWWKNFVAKTPQRNKKLRNVAVSIITAATSLEAVLKVSPQYLQYLPSYTEKLLAYIILSGVVFGLYHQSKSQENEI